MIHIKNNVYYDRKQKVNLRNASGRLMDVQGLATVKSRPKYINGFYNKSKKRTITSIYIVTKDMHNEILIPREDLKKFGVIPMCFPHVETRMTEVEDKTDSEEETVTDNEHKLPVKAVKEMEGLLNSYQDVISDTLSQERFLGEKADIYFNDKYVKPLHRTTAKIPPRAHQALAQSLIEEHLKSGVLIEEDRPSAWCSEGKFVEKKLITKLCTM